MERKEGLRMKDGKRKDERQKEVRTLQGRKCEH